MKKIIAVLVFALALSLSVSAQRDRYSYAGAGITGAVVADESGIYAASYSRPGVFLTYGFRNYNPDAFVSFSYEAEGHVYFYNPGVRTFVFGAAPEIGVFIGPTWLKWHGHSGVSLDYLFANGIKFGFKFGSGIDIAKHLMLDFSYTFHLGRVHNAMFVSSLCWRF